MDVTCISDLHGNYPELEGGDLLIIAGDYTASDKITQWEQFFKWLKGQDYRKKILIAGNHDNFMMSGFPHNQLEAEGISDFEYLCDSGTEFIYEERDTEQEICGNVKKKA